MPVVPLYSSGLRFKILVVSKNYFCFDKFSTITDVYINYLRLDVYSVAFSFVIQDVHLGSWGT